ncbi:MAG: DUF4321 domain-containing protein [Lachnospiraceae bacterium]|nr:DUF4321 domain-containing protein [Lachnospiraceae bacterium]
MTLKGKSTWSLILFLMCGIVLGGFIGELLGQFDFFYWLAYGKTFGIPTVTLNLSVLQLTFGLQITLNLASVLGMCVALFVHRKM